jgi:beta-lactamase superfamily II metal-dependent hydrolase
VVIDGGYSYTGEQVIEHLDHWYDTNHVDLMISTHPDQDHINGLATVLQGVSCDELLIHRPHDHAADVTHFSNIEVVDALIGLAEDNGVAVNEPFTGLTRFGGHIRVLGPTEKYYEELVAEHLKEMESGVAEARMSHAQPGLLRKAIDLLDRALDYLPIETLGEDGDSGPRNESSVITLLQVGGERLLFTGDAGIDALNAGWDEYERVVGSFPDAPLDFFQAPHHGSRRNLAPSLLNRIFGSPGENALTVPAFISSAKNDPKHPSPKVTNALRRRGVDPYATESNTLCHKSDDAPTRYGWITAPVIGPLEEED